MTSKACDSRQKRWANPRNGLRHLALLGALAFAAGCGASARPDFDVNAGMPENVEAGTIEAERIRELFPLVGDPADSAWNYRIVAGDQLEIAFFSHPEQNRFVTVRPDGMIGLPYVGDVAAAGRMPGDLATELQEAYSEVLVSPRVDVIVQEMGARFYVIGQVTRPGEFVYDRRMDLLQALARAGGYDNSARLTNIVLMRTDLDGRTYAAIFDFRQYMETESRIGSLAVRPDDVIWVPRNSLSKWDVGSRQAFSGLQSMSRVAIDAWSLVNFEDVYENRFNNN